MQDSINTLNDYSKTRGFFIKIWFSTNKYFLFKCTKSGTKIVNQNFVKKRPILMDINF